ncbi:hypothetical protein BS47DRAFT_1321642, partial [Hydnum rufescens UP504]
MGERALETHPAIEDFFALHKYRDSTAKNLTDAKWKILGDVVGILSYPHDIQQLMSGEATPSLTGVLPTFQGLQNRWEVLLSTIAPTQKHYILAAMEWLNKYHEKARKTPAYVMAMVLNPSIKFSFIMKYWSPIEQETAMDWIKAELATYRAREASKLTTSSSRKKAACPHSRLGLKSDDEEDNETDLDTECTLYISER